MPLISALKMDLYRRVRQQKRASFQHSITYRAYLKEVFSKRMTEFEKQKFEIEELLLLLEPYTDGEQRTETANTSVNTQ